MYNSIETTEKTLETYSPLEKMAENADEIRLYMARLKAGRAFGLGAMCVSTGIFLTNLFTEGALYPINLENALTHSIVHIGMMVPTFYAEHAIEKEEKKEQQKCGCSCDGSCGKG